MFSIKLISVVLSFVATHLLLQICPMHNSYYDLANKEWLQLGLLALIVTGAKSNLIMYEWLFFVKGTLITVGKF